MKAINNMEEIKKDKDEWYKSDQLSQNNIKGPLPIDLPKRGKVISTVREEKIDSSFD